MVSNEPREMPYFPGTRERPIELSSDDSSGVYHYHPSKEIWGMEVDSHKIRREEESDLSGYQADSEFSNWRIDTPLPHVSSLHAGTSCSKKPRMSVRTSQENI
ncbi:hypothetical protein L1987_03909 [Smallanthus sonchifolius]|uniref:Uncharacterized protein n=1 Tax=Smallanthus sonchifolius TaxID=185202 RepID=A0ACB9KC14_9ASTR|nr:hypothetical protein L1987_03909 [Smallanthus sonchifolius]